MCSHMSVKQGIFFRHRNNRTTIIIVIVVRIVIIVIIARVIIIRIAIVAIRIMLQNDVTGHSCFYTRPLNLERSPELNPMVSPNHTHTMLRQ